jgi:acyl-CoA thioester hydrolase
MDNVFFEGQVMWSQVDANMHLRHSAYADFGAQARVILLEKVGFNSETLQSLKIGPILFREELIYLREVRPNDIIRVTCEMTKGRTDGSRWSFRHELYRGDGIKAAIINVDGAWIDVEARKLAALPEAWAEKFMHIPKTIGFIEEVVSIQK